MKLSACFSCFLLFSVWGLLTLSFVRLLIERRADVNALDDHGWAPLHVAAGAGVVL